MCTVSLFPPNFKLTLDYATLNMDYTNDMWETANRVSLLTYAIPLAFVAAAEVIKNGVFLLYNAFVFVINTVSSLIHRISSVFSGCFDDCVEGNFNIQSINPFAAPVEGNFNIHTIPSIFSNDDLATFRLAIRDVATRGNATQGNPIEAYLQDQQCAIWYDLARDMVFIQDKHRPGNPTLAMKINECGYILSLEVDGVSHNEFPAEFEAFMSTCFQEAFKASSQYEFRGGSIEIRVVREGLKEIPDFHLEKLAEQLTLLNNIAGIRVNFLNSQLQNGEGMDLGGPRRDYMDDLWKGILNGNSQVLEFSRREGQKEAMPKTSGAEGPDGIPRVSAQEIPLFRHMGTIMMYCYQNPDRLTIGRRFEEGLFKAICRLTEAEINVDNLPFPVQLKMMRAIMECRELDIEETPISILEGWVEGHIDWEAAKNYAKNILLQDVPDFNALNLNHQNQVIQALKGYLYDECGSALAPMHQIAKGMNDWTGSGLNGIAWKAFSDKVQGSLDKGLIVANLDIGGNEHVQRKGQWIREWILDPATTNKQLQQFIKFATGSSSLGQGDRIKIRAQLLRPERLDDRYIPLPKAHSCFNQIDIAPVADAQMGTFRDGTKEEFLRAFTYGMQNSDYQMG